MSIHTIGNARFIDLPIWKPICEEVFSQDCYHLKDIPDGSIVMDVGAFYGEFGIYCAMNKGCKVMAYEPAAPNFEVSKLNIALNQIGLEKFQLMRACIAAREGEKKIVFKPHHPAGSETDIDGDGEMVPCLRLQTEILMAKNLFGDGPVVVKMDCESDEQEIFIDQSWIDMVQVIAMEWHNYDGEHYASILRSKGFDVILEAGGPEPKPKCDNTISGGIIFAKRL